MTLVQCRLLTCGFLCPTGMANHPPIPVMDLADHLERLKANDNLKFSQEYEVRVSDSNNTVTNQDKVNGSVLACSVFVLIRTRNVT